jgi:predicted nucleic acid-binding protein
VSVTQLLAAKGARPIRSLDELAADTFESDEELEEFLAFTYAERHRDLAWSSAVDPAVLDTDVASLLHKGTLAGPLAARLIGREPLITFVTFGELAKWAEIRNWGQHRRQELTSWLSRIAVLPGDEAVAATWGRLSAAAVRRGRPRPVNDMWVAACCLTHGIPLATLNLKDYEDFNQHHGLRSSAGNSGGRRLKRFAS